MQRPAVLVPGLTAKPWHDAANYDALLCSLRAAHDVLAAGWASVWGAGRMRPQAEGLQEPGQRWSVFDIGAACESEATRQGPAVQSEADESASTAATVAMRSTAMATHTPLQRVCELLAQLRRDGRTSSPPYEPLKAQFSTMAPGVHVRPHTGPTNAKLTLHYGLAVPEGTSIRVASERRPFAQRGLIAFDDSFVHEVWHDGSGHRTTLVLHVAHPGMGGREMRS